MWTRYSLAVEMARQDAHFAISLILTLVCIEERSASTCTSYVGNQTILPHTNPKTVFETYGYSDEYIPRDLSHIKVNLLHEENILHVVNHLNEFKLNNEGFISKLYEGEIRLTGGKVLVKKLNTGNFDDVLNEGVIMTYLRDNPHIPIVYGLLPSGPTFDDVAIVLQFIQNGTNLHQLLSEPALVTECQWLNISQQLASVLLNIHQKYVLFNDLHESNILIQWRGSLPFVYIIDYGQAAFRQGESFSDTPESERDLSSFMGPEVWYDITSPASDVYSLGDMLMVMSDHVKYQPYHDLAHKCRQEIVRNRIKLELAVNELNKIFNDRCLEEVGNVNSDSLANINSRNNALNLTAKLKEAHPMESPVPIISWAHLTIKTTIGQWVNSNDDVLYRTGHYPTTNTEIVVKEFTNENFDDLRVEAIINSIMNDTDFVLKIYGLVPTETYLTQFCLVQEYIESADVLGDIFDKLKTTDDSYKITLAFHISKAVAMFHSRHFVINDISPENILVITRNHQPTIKFIDLRKCTRTNETPYWDTSGDHSCPSLHKTNRVTYSSDVYSLGVVLRHIFTSCMDFTVLELISRSADPNPSKRPSVLEIELFFGKKLWTSFGI